MPEMISNDTQDSAMVDYVAGRIADAAEVRRSRQFPYQFLAAAETCRRVVGLDSPNLSLTQMAVASDVLVR